jgi:biopolymer transport protein ExbD
MAGGGGSIDSGEPEFQIAPMIDVLLVMLIFFMTITSTQVLRVDKEVTLPVAPNSVKKENTRLEALINVRWDPDAKRADVNFEDRIYPSMEELVPILKARRGEDAKYRAVIRGDRKVPARYIAQVMGACGEAGIADIAFSTVNKEKL